MRLESIAWSEVEASRFRLCVFVSESSFAVCECVSMYRRAYAARIIVLIFFVPRYESSSYGL